MENYYFDDQQLRLRKKKFALRIRVVDGKRFFFTLKYPAAKRTNTAGPRSFKVRVEHEVPISKTLAQRILSQDARIMDLNVAPVKILKRTFPKNVLAKVRPLGLIQCKRTIVPLERWLELEIDRCKIFNKKFYEVEVETSNPQRVDRAIRVFLKEHKIPYHPISRSKFARFVQEWKKKKR